MKLGRTSSASSGMLEAPDTSLTSTQQGVQNLGEPLVRPEQLNRQAEDPEIQAWPLLSSWFRKGHPKGTRTLRVFRSSEYKLTQLLLQLLH